MTSINFVRQLKILSGKRKKKKKIKASNETSIFSCFERWSLPPSSPSPPHYNENRAFRTTVSHLIELLTTSYRNIQDLVMFRNRIPS